MFSVLDKRTISSMNAIFRLARPSRPLANTSDYLTPAITLLPNLPPPVVHSLVPVAFLWSFPRKLNLTAGSIKILFWTAVELQISSAGEICIGFLWEKQRDVLWRRGRRERVLSGKNNRFVRIFLGFSRCDNIDLSSSQVVRKNHMVVRHQQRNRLFIRCLVSLI